MKNKAFLWYDPEGGVLEISFGERPDEGEMMETKDRDIMVRVDDKGNVIGFQLIGLKGFDGTKVGDVELDLTPVHREHPVRSEPETPANGKADKSSRASTSKERRPRRQGEQRGNADGDRAE